MAFDFPSTPTEGQLFTPSGGQTYVYRAPAWELLPKIGGAPFSALAYNNIILNGGFDFNREYGNGMSNGWVNYTYPFCDQWAASNRVATPGSVNFSYGNVAPPAPHPFASAFAFCGKAQVYGAGTSFPTASDYFLFEHRIEGSRMAPLGFGFAAAIPVTLSFWVYASVTGTFSVMLTNNPEAGGGWRTYSHNFTVNAANTWEFKSFTYPPDTSGGITNWKQHNVAGAYLEFCFGAGSGNKGQTPDAWLSDWLTNSTPQQSNFFATVNNAVHLTGVSLLPGSVGPTAAESLQLRRPYAEEEMLLQRYWHDYWYIIYPASLWYMSTQLTSMRANPTLTTDPAAPGLTLPGNNPHSFGCYADAYGAHHIYLDARL